MKDPFDDRGPAQVDLCDEQEIVQHIRDLLNLSEFLEKGLDTELHDFIKKLKAIEWSDDKISEFITQAASWTRYEQLIPHSIPSRGEWKEWLKIKAIHK